VNTSQRNGSPGADVRAVLVRRIAHELRVRHRRRVHADLVRARVKQAAHVGDGAHAAADRQRNEDLRGHRFDDRQDQVAPVGSGGDVEEGEFVGALFVIAARDFDGVARVAQLDEVDALDDPSGGHVETGDDAFG
jgi:hypothetical protein